MGNTTVRVTHYPSSHSPQRETDRECIVKETREVEVQREMSMEKETQKRVTDTV